MKSILVTTTILVAMASAAGCGGGSDGATNGGSLCGSTPACGGDVTGTWNVTSSCEEVAPESRVRSTMPPACQGTAADGITTTDTTGLTLSFLANGTYAYGGTYRWTTAYVYSDACLRAVDGPVDPAVACGTFTQPGWTCVYDSTLHECKCSISGQSLPGQTGTYRVTGTQISLGAASGPYCQQGSTLGMTVADTGTIQRLELSR